MWRETHNMISKQKRDKIVSQSIQEIQLARTYKQGIVWRWFKNEDLFYIKKDGRYDRSENIDSDITDGSNVNIPSAKMYSYVETFLSKIDSPLTFKFMKKKMSDFKRVKLMNALKEQDANDDDWNIKDLVGKINAILYGRAIFSYHASSDGGEYQPHLSVIDPYDFLIDPSGGGLNLDDAMFMGVYNIRRNKQQLINGKKSGKYIKEEVDRLINGSGNDANQLTQEDINKQNKYSYISSPGNRIFNSGNVYKFWHWYTTYEGERYYLMMTEDGICIRCELLTDMFKVDPRIGDANFPFWSYSFLPNGTEFWIPSKVDYVREIFLAQGVSINQMLDNSDRINKPQRAVDVGAITSVGDLKYKRNGIIRMKPGTDVNRAFNTVVTPALNAPITVYNTLETIGQLEGGVTAGSKGIAEEDKVGIYEGNQAAAADRYGVANKAYSQGYKRFAMLWKNGVDDHLTKKKAVNIIGARGLEETIFVSKRDLKPQNDYHILVEASNAEEQADAIDKKNKLTFLGTYKGDPIVNQKLLFEKGAEIVGYSQEEVRQFLDTESYGSADVISECERDIEEILNKKVIPPNEIADTAYMTHLISYMRDHKEDMDEDTWMLFMDYIDRVEPIVVRNMGSKIMNDSSRAMLEGAGNPASGANLASIQPEVAGQTEGQLQTNEPGGTAPVYQ